MITSNFKIDGSQTSVAQILAHIPKTNPDSYTVHGTIPLPSWSGLNKHIQGIAPYNGSGVPIVDGCITGSSTQGYFAGFSQATDSNPQVRSVTEPDANYYHAAGIQMLGDLLPVPLESKDPDQAKVMFYNVGNLAAPQYMYEFAAPAHKASAVGITTYTDATGTEQAVLAVYQYDDRQMYFYRALASALDGGSDHKNNPWVLIKTYAGDALKGDQYQCFAMVTQTNPGTGASATVTDQVYLLGFREDEELHLFTVDTSDGGNFGNLTVGPVYKGWNGSDWRYGVGLQIAGTTRLRIFGTDKDPSGTASNYTFKVYVWG